jgi:gamma-glutamyltranspeptidase/glutathione hydrolase
VASAPSSAAAAPPADADAAPAAALCERRSDPGRQSPVLARRVMAASAHPLASEAGCRVLARGGSAVDAAVAIQMVLAVVEPQSSGLGGGTLVTYYDRRSGRVEFHDGLAESPAVVTAGLRTPTAAETAELGVTEFGSDVTFTGRAVGVPGTVAVLDRLHRRHGRMPWRSLFDGAITSATGGFPVSPYLHDTMSAEVGGLGRCGYPDLAARYCAGNQPLAVGATAYNTDLAAVLREVRDGGAAAFYDPAGTIAPAITARAAAGPYKLTTDDAGPAVIPALMTPADLAGYRAVQRDPLCRQAFAHRVCTAAPPSFGGLTVLQILGLLERAGPPAAGTLQRAHYSIDASRLAQFDRREYVGDPDFEPTPVDGLLAKDYLDARFALLSPTTAVQRVEPGNPGGDAETTSHVSVVDRFGDAVSMTTTVNSSFGAQIEARGMILNNVHENFTRPDSISPGQDVNEMEAGKRPRSSVAPTIVLDRSGRLRLVVGAAGGSAIPDYVSQAIVGVLVDGYDPQAAINQAHWSGQEITSNCGGVIGPRSEVEAGTSAAALLDGLRGLQHPCARAVELRSGSAAVEVNRWGLLAGAADPRRDGTAVGD